MMPINTQSVDRTKRGLGAPDGVLSVWRNESRKCRCAVSTGAKLFKCCRCKGPCLERAGCRHADAVAGSEPRRARRRILDTGCEIRRKDKVLA